MKMVFSAKRWENFSYQFILTMARIERKESSSFDKFANTLITVIKETSSEFTIPENERNNDEDKSNALKQVKLGNKLKRLRNE